MSENTANLLDDRAATVALLREPLAWRVRAVEKIVVDAASTCLRRRSVQVAPLREILRDYLPTDNSSGVYTHAILPVFVAPFPRGPLLDFDVEGPDGPASLLPRSEIATREARYLEGLASACGVAVPGVVGPLLVAVLGYSGTPSARADPQVGAMGDHWQAANSRCHKVLDEYIESVDASAPDHPSLVVPELVDNGFLPSPEGATEVLNEYASTLERVHAVATSAAATSAPLAREFLRALGDYAISYDLMAVMRVPLDEPFVIKYSERRNLYLDAKKNCGDQEMVVADARTNHVTVMVDDPNVRIAKAETFAAGTRDYAAGTSVTRRNDQYIAFYSHDPNRDYRIRVEFRLGLLLRLESVPLFAATLVALLSLAIWDLPDIDVRTLALLGGPAALAASVLVGREQSTLGSRLRVRSSAVLALSLVSLVATVVILYVVRVR